MVVPPFPPVNHILFVYPLVNVYITNCKDPPFLMGKSTISMAMFNSFLYVYQRILLVLVTTQCHRSTTNPTVVGNFTDFADRGTTNCYRICGEGSRGSEPSPRKRHGASVEAEVDSLFTGGKTPADNGTGGIRSIQNWYFFSKSHPNWCAVSIGINHKPLFVTQ
jgi:hypothetical protein